MNLMEIIAYWKTILGTVAAILVVLLQVIQVLLSTGIENELAQKTQAIVAKASALDELIDKNRSAIDSNNALIEKNSKRHDDIVAQISALQAELRVVDDEIKEINGTKK